MMPTIAASAEIAQATALRKAPSKVDASQKVVIVNGSAGILELLQTLLAAGHYDVIFVESSERAYSQIRRVRPNLVILCVDIEDPDGFQVLSMLKLDEDTRGIPVLTYTTEGEEDQAESSAPEPFGPDVLAAAPALRMN